MTGHRVVAGTKAARRMTSAKGSQFVDSRFQSGNSAEVIEHNKRVEFERQQDLVKRQQRRLERERWKR